MNLLVKNKMETSSNLVAFSKNTNFNYFNSPSSAVSYETICIQRHLLQFKKRTWHRSPFRLLLPHCASFQSKWNRFCSKTLILRKDWIHWSYPIKKWKKINPETFATCKLTRTMKLLQRSFSYLWTKFEYFILCVPPYWLTFTLQITFCLPWAIMQVISNLKLKADVIS